MAGVLVGPFTFDNPIVADVPTIRRLADVGLVLLLFGLGLEFGWERIRQVGLKVLFIGALEITFLVALGFQIGVALGWTDTEAIFLGAAISISSSAVLIKMLGDSGELLSARGRMIVGILVVEDFAAVILLSILSGVASGGTANIGEIGLIAGKLALFTGTALVAGALVVPRLIDFIARSRSSETLLVASLALAFGLALVGELLGISAAAGAFLIGAVLGDTKHAHAISERMQPVRDMFGALFFVSVGMLVDIHQIGEFIVPALIVSAVFIAGKIVANTIGVFVTGTNGTDSLRVGMGMPQSGEFSLAMVKVGADHGAIGPFLYPVIAVVTGITSVLYPLFYRSSEGVSGFLNRRSPRVVKSYVDSLGEWLAALQKSFQFNSPSAKEIQRSGRVLLVNLALMALLIGVGTFVLRFSEDLGEFIGVAESIIGLAISASVLGLCLPSGVVVWRESSKLADLLTASAFRPRTAESHRWRTEEIRRVLRDSILAASAVLLGVWAVPLLSQLLSLGEFSVPIPVIFLAGIAFVLARSVLKLHSALENTLERTMLGPAETSPATAAAAATVMSSTATPVPGVGVTLGQEREVGPQAAENTVPADGARLQRTPPAPDPEPGPEPGQEPDKVVSAARSIKTLRPRRQRNSSPPPSDAERPPDAG
ncbi:MAG: cation:proton antiporter [Chloroflexi bacterium]|nr:cation:proton antiporter [Chloroflexota bacterium]